MISGKEFHSIYREKKGFQCLEIRKTNQHSHIDTFQNIPPLVFLLSGNSSGMSSFLCSSYPPAPSRSMAISKTFS